MSIPDPLFSQCCFLSRVCPANTLFLHGKVRGGRIHGLERAPGFEVDLVYKVDKKKYGSWIAMAS